VGIKQTVNRLHWSYFIALGQDLTQASRFIEFTEKNYSVFSIELAHILLATSSEVDVILKDLCNIINEDKKHENINDYKETIQEKLPNIINEVCYIPRFGLELHPWSNWNDDSNPNWWRSYNNVKHQRSKYFEEANLKHALNSLAALNNKLRHSSIILPRHLKRFPLAVTAEKTCIHRSSRFHPCRSRRFTFPSFKFYWEADSKGTPGVWRRAAKTKLRGSVRACKEWLKVNWCKCLALCSRP